MSDKSGIGQVFLINSIGNISSIATLLLFLIYFIGRITTIILEKNFIYEFIDVYRGDDLLNIYEKYKIIDEYLVGKDSDETLIITPEKGLNWIKAYEYNPHNKKKGKIIFEHDCLPSNLSIKIDTYLTCGMPRYILEFERYDFLRGEYYLAENNKDGIASIKMRHTWKSILYSIVK